LTRVWIALGRLEDALDLLDRLAPLAETGKRFGRLLEIRLLQAIAWFTAHNIAQAHQALDACLAMAEPEGLRRAFLDEGEPARAALSSYLASSHPAHSSFARELLDAFAPVSSGEPFTQSSAGLVEALTRREMEVLRLISAGDSNQEIAQKLVVTISAVKKHSGNIYGKLGVTSRTQAIAKARELGLLA
ncbi:MAG: helix-turn-helix transcriptional regulator, partial [Chloroflexota bacterium]